MDKLADQNEQRQKIVIGLSGGESSFVAAYLLKIQKYDLIGVTVVQRSNPETKCAITDQDLARIKDFCHRLNISHVVIDADNSFTENVQNEWVARKMELKSAPFSCLSCHQLRLGLLYKKMLELEADFISTGHFAKIFKTEQEIAVHSVHDLTLDQSHFLQRIDKKILDSLLLPLGSLGSAEITKLVQNFSLKSVAKDIDECFVGEYSEGLLKHYPGLSVTGEIVNSNGVKLGFHQGIGQLESGQEIFLNGAKYFISSKVRNSTNVMAEKESYFIRHKIKLNRVFWTEDENSFRPHYAYLNGPGTSLKVKVYPKTHECVIVELPEDMEFKEHQELFLYNKMSGNSKLVLSGTIEFPQEATEEAPDDWESLF